MTRMRDLALETWSSNGARLSKVKMAFLIKDQKVYLHI